MKHLGWIVVGLLALSGCAQKRLGQWERQTKPMSERAAIHYEFAREAYFSGDLIPALASALKAVDLSPSNSEIRNLLGLIYFRQDKLSDAEVEFKAAIKLDPGMPEAFNNLGTLYLAGKNYAEAKNVLLKGLENPLYLYPERLQNNLGLAYLGLGEQNLAIEAFESAIKMNKGFYLPYLHLGRLFFDKGENSRAEPLLKEAVRLCSNCSEQRYYLGRILLRNNKTQEALNLFKEGASVDPEGYFGKQCQQYVVSR
jgi:Flp pilus assembly protein TadD